MLTTWQDALLLAIALYLAFRALRRFYRRNWHVFHGYVRLEGNAETREVWKVYPEPWSGLRTMRVSNLKLF
jgi:hypothetical protein